MKQDLDWDCQVTLAKGKGASVTLMSGLRVEHIEDVGQAFRVRIDNPPYNSKEELETWIIEKAGITAEDIKWINFSSSGKRKQGPATGEDSGHAIVVLRNEVAASAVLSSISDGEGTATKMEDWGRNVAWSLPELIEDAKPLLSSLGCKAPSKIKQLISKPVFKIVLNNVRPQVTNDSISSLLGTSKPDKIVSLGRNPQAATRVLMLEFSSSQACDAALEILRTSSLATEKFVLDIV